MRVTYWAHSKWVKKLRVKLGAPKPLECGTSSEWKTYRKACKQWNKTLDWLLDDFIDHVQDVVYWPKDKLESFSYWIYNRFISPTHLIKTGLQKGQWHETEEKMLYGLFEELVDFVEVQKAGMNYNDKKWIPWYDKHLPYFISKMIPWRSQHLGVNYLLWEITLLKDDEWFGIYPGSNIERITEVRNDSEWMQPTHQAKAAMEILELYVWWKFIRPMRPDPMDASGYTDYFAECRARTGGDIWDMLDTDSESAESKARSRACSDKCREIEEQYENEDEQMMIRLIKVRRSLWT